MSSADALAGALAPHATALIGLAHASIRAGLATGRALPVTPDDHPAELREQAASFVTLHIDSRLRGCIGSLEARAALVEDVARNAFLAAFEDPRFPPLTAGEAPRLAVEISVLTTPEPLPFSSEAELLARLRPGHDGLIIEAFGRHGVFLPQVWESLPEADDFLDHLKDKAGLGGAPLGADARARRFAVVKLDASAIASA